MGLPSDSILSGLKLLRKGRGVFDRQAAQRAGQQLRALCEIGADDDLVAGRAKLIDKLTKLAEELPPDERLAVLASLAVHPQARHRFLHERVTWVAERLDREERTVRRRADDGIRTLAEIAAAASEPAAGPQLAPGKDRWLIASFDALLRLDGEVPEVFERRSIVFDEDGVTRITAELSLPPRSGVDQNIEAEILYGGRISRAERESASHFRFTIDLPRAFDRGNEHSYAMRYWLPSHRSMQPHYAFIPFRPCGSFNLRLRFSPAEMPLAIWRLDGVAPRAIDDRQLAGETLHADSIGDLLLEFRDLRPGLAFGAQWAPSGQSMRELNGQQETIP